MKLFSPFQVIQGTLISSNYVVVFVRKVFVLIGSYSDMCEFTLEKSLLFVHIVEEPSQ
jgi:hypothetical protein